MPSMDSAPKDDFVELLVDGEWIEAEWSSTAYDGSPHGVEGWAQLDGNYAILDAEAWRPFGIIHYGEESPLPGHNLRQPIIVLGLAFGDEAKGATVDYLSFAIPDASAVVRWSGGANAAHNVRHGPRHHTFRQFGAGTLLGLPTYLTDRVVLNLQLLMSEAVELESKGVHSPLSLLTLHSDSLVTTPIHMALNRAREILRGSRRHGSCGLGIGETIAHGYAERNGLTVTQSVGNFELPGPTAHGEGLLTVGKLVRQADEDLEAQVIRILENQARYAEPLIQEAIAFAPDFADELSYDDLHSMAQDLIEVANSVDVLSADDFEEQLEQTMARGTVIFEGSQGVFLDEQWGFHPHTTWAQTEPSDLVESLAKMGHRPYVLGLTRSFTTRHGAGPLPSHDPEILNESLVPSDDNSWGRWQGGFRVAPLDVPLLHYSIDVLSRSGTFLDGLSVSHLDVFESELPLVVSYDGNTAPSYNWRFISDRAPDFPLMNSDAFVEDRIIGKMTELIHSKTEDLPGKLGAMLNVPPVLIADGPERRNRSIYQESRQ